MAILAPRETLRGDRLLPEKDRLLAENGFFNPESGLLAAEYNDPYHRCDEYAPHPMSTLVMQIGDIGNGGRDK